MNKKERFCDVDNIVEWRHIITALLTLVSMAASSQQVMLADSITKNPDAKTGAPKDESLIDGGIILPSSQKLGKDGISLPRPIPFPQTGVFVVVEWITTAQVSESCNLVPSLNMTLDEVDNRTWNKKTFRGMDWMQEQNEPAYQNEEAQVFYKGRTPSAKLGLKVSK